MKKLYFLLFGLMAGLFVQGQVAQKNLSLLSQVTFNDALNDIWAWEDGNGGEYAIVGLNNSTAIVDVSSPSSPVVLQSFPGASSIWRDIKTYQNYAYVTNETSGGLLIIDLSTLPNTVASKDTVIAGLNTAHNVYMENGYLYVVGGDIDNGGITIYDLTTDPWRPSKIGSFSDRYVHDVYVRNDTAYAAEINNGLLEIIDVTSKTNPVVLGTKSYVNSFTHNTWLNDAGDVCFSTDELAEAYIYSWDVSDPSNIKELDKIRSSLSAGLATPHNVHVLNDFIVTSYYKDGIQIVDAARPHNLIEVGYYDTSPMTGGGTDGCWGAYPFLSSGVVLATDIDEGFFVLDPTYTRACYLEGTVTDSTTGMPIQGADIDIQTTSVVDVSGSAGEYATGTADPGTFNVSYSKFGYVTKVIPTTLTNGQLVLQDVELVETPKVNYTITVQEAGTGTPIGSAVAVAESQGIKLNYTSDASGLITDNNFNYGTYSLIVGKWGYVTKEVTITADANNSSVVVELDKGYYDDFALDFGWTLFGAASAGEWERGEPIGTTYFNAPFAPDDDLNFDIGDQCYVTGNGGGNAGQDDVDQGETILRSPQMDLTAYASPQIKIYRWFANDGGAFGGNPPNDTLKFRLSNGITSVTFGQVSSSQISWVLDSFLVAPLITPTSTMTFEVICGDYGDGHLVEGAIDHFTVSEGEAVAIDEEIAAKLPALEVYPNPVQASSQVQYNLGQLTEGWFEIRDLQGRVLQRRSLSLTQGAFDLGLKAPAGVYVGVLGSEEATLKTFKIVK